MISILLLFSLLISNIGIVKTGDACCSKTTSAVMQPLLSAICCCSSESNDIENCCKQISSFSKLTTDVDQLKVSDSESSKFHPLLIGIINYGFGSNNKNYTYTNFLSKNIISRPPGSAQISYYKLFRKLVLYA
jgi:hypothetical protein